MQSWAGIIVAGGVGPRGWELAGVQSPCLAPVANRALLLHGLELLEIAGVQRVAVVCETAIAEAVRGVVAAAPAGMPLSVVEVPDGCGELTAVLAAIEVTNATRLLVFAGDSLVDEGIVPAVERLDAEGLDTIVLERTGSPQSAGHSSGAAAQVRLLPALAQRAGVLMLGPAGVQGLRELERQGEAESDLDQIAEALYGRPPGSGADAAWRLKPTAESLLEANRRALERISRDVPAEDSFLGSTIHGQVVVHDSAIVDRTLIRGPAIIGRDARLEDAYVGPYTSIGDGCLVRGTEVEHSILLAGARVSDVGCRIESSVIGPGARVFRTFALPKALHMHIGPRASINVS